MSKNTTENYFALATLGTMIFLGIQRYSISGCYFLVNIAHVERGAHELYELAE